jgi:hypothetical protein
MNKPEKLIILGIPYTIVYCDKPYDVDNEGRKSLFGCCDYWKREIRIYNAKKIEDIWETLWHEILHAIADLLKLEILNVENDKKHDELDILALALNDTLIRNNLIKID